MKSHILFPLAAVLSASIAATPLWARHSSAAGAIHLSTAALSFNGSSGNLSSQPLTITSTGSRAVTIHKLSISNGSFSHAGVSLPVTLAKGHSITVKVVAQPHTSAQIGTLTVDSSAGDPRVSLTETAIAPKTPSYSVDLHWNPSTGSSDAVDSYEIQRATSGSSTYTTVGTTAAASTSYADTTVRAGQTYIYDVRALDSQGELSGPSNSITLTIP